MLVLTRKAGEQIIIGDNIRLTVVSVGPGRVKIGIEAPSSVKVDRQEIYDKKQHEQEVTEEAAPAIVVRGDRLTLHNRISDKLPEAEKRIVRRFPPRKPR
jgi:carbon storage regulator